MRMIFHHPLPVRPDAQAASGIRPYRMIEAFRALGYEVDAVCGYADERAAAIAAVDRRLAAGGPYAFMYAESSTEPTLLTEPHHLPVRPWLDFGFFARVKARGVPIGLFYRDVYWRFPAYGAALPWWKAAVARLFYRYDLLQYRRLLDRLYLPSLAMGPHVHWVARERMAALPPGYAPRALAHRPADALRLLYVGGLGDHYRMHALFRALAELPQVELTLCTRAAEWEAVRDQYPLPAAGNVRVVHRSGDGLIELFEQADVCLLYVEPQPYREFAAPVKLYEYIGAERPVLASEGTLAAEFVAAQGIGWSVPYAADAVGALLRRLAADRSLLEPAHAALRRIQDRHSWTARAREVADDLTRVSR